MAVVMGVVIVSMNRRGQRRGGGSGRGEVGIDCVWERCGGGGVGWDGVVLRLRAIGGGRQSEWFR